MSSLRPIAQRWAAKTTTTSVAKASPVAGLRYNSSSSSSPPSSSSSSSSRGPSSSTSALAYKALHRRSAPLPKSAATPAWSAQSAVSNILYETPTPPTDPPKRHILNCLVQNEPGVLSRLSGIIAARGFNIDSLVVCNTEVEDLSRMTIVLTGHDGVVEQARRQLEDLVPVWAVLDYTEAALVQRELLLAKINILGPEYFEELLHHHREITTGHPAVADELAAAAAEQGQQQTLEQTAKDFHPSKLAASEALRHKHEHLKSITYFAHQFGGKVLDISNTSCIVEVSAKQSRIDSFLKLVGPFGILESARTGLMALPRSPLHGINEEAIAKEADEAVDASQLPPG
ncbi:small subunit of acetolactate synthase-domain-containing protein [Emericellopsis atlantica]|uniref:Small subunit of acetolactate synthase-domain-containing protein n=1 Tax=Emericellopsis atlantica TaxID=2614577 RepID=A0A9P7ZSF3_9HYPO|nr:small subunit of acetolactate synthase-domain-containing protein [Emericellopsis atlantica]KAG9257479.1 small subunit of acetolactate synthase-domain-containing protein [Emericellopsis atlantica]